MLNDVTPKYEDKIHMYKVNIEDETELAVTFGARSIPYMVFISKGGEIEGTPGALNKDQLKYYLDGLISK